MKPLELSNSDFEMHLRKSYIKPRIERVSLVPDETVLGGCKISTGGSGPAHLGCLADLDDPCFDNNPDTAS